MQPKWMATIGILLIGAGIAVVSGKTDSVDRKAAVQEMEKNMVIQKGSEVEMAYRLTVEGEVIDSSEGKPPLKYTHGSGQIIIGLERELEGMEVGESKDVTVAPEEAYGVVDPNAIVEIPKDKLPADITPEVGLVLELATPQGQSFAAKVQAVGEETLTVDMNHPLAGKTLEFFVEIKSIKPVE